MDYRSLRSAVDKNLAPDLAPLYAVHFPCGVLRAEEAMSGAENMLELVLLLITPVGHAAQLWKTQRWLCFIAPFIERSDRTRQSIHPSGRPG